MSIGYVVKLDTKLVVVAWDGMTKLIEWQDHLTRLFADPDYVSAKIQLTDTRFSSIDPSITGDEIRRVVESMAVERDKIAHKRLAIVAGPDWERAKLVERLLQPLMATPIVFTDLITACLWLGLDPADVGNEIKQLRLSLRHTS